MSTVARPITRDRGPLGERLLTLRLESGMTQDELADKVGVSQGRIGEIESGANRNPHLATLMAIAKALKVEAADIIAAIGQASSGKNNGRRKKLSAAS